MDITAEDYRLANEDLKERIRFMSAELKDKTQHVVDLEAQLSRVLAFNESFEAQLSRMQVELFEAITA